MAASRTEVTTPSEVEFQLTRAFNAPRELLWDLFTKPEHVTQWLLGPDGWSMPVCEIDLRPGGSWHYQWRHESGETMEMNGVYQEVTWPARLVNTESWGGPYPETLNTVTFSEEQSGKTVVSTVIRYPSSDAREVALATGMTRGVERSYARLEEVLTGLQAQG